MRKQIPEAVCDMELGRLVEHNMPVYIPTRPTISMTYFERQFFNTSSDTGYTNDDLLYPANLFTTLLNLDSKPRPNHKNRRMVLFLADFCLVFTTWCCISLL